MHLQLHVYEPYENNYTVLEPHAYNLVSLYFPTNNAQVWICIETHSSDSYTAATAVVIEK